MIIRRDTTRDNPAGALGRGIHSLANGRLMQPVPTRRLSCRRPKRLRKEWAATLADRPAGFAGRRARKAPGKSGAAGSTGGGHRQGLDFSRVLSSWQQSWNCAPTVPRCPRARPERPRRRAWQRGAKGTRTACILTSLTQAMIDAWPRPAQAMTTPLKSAGGRERSSAVCTSFSKKGPPICAQ